MLRVILPSVIDQIAAGKDPAGGITNKSCR
jgi:hypothetical protein